MSYVRVQGDGWLQCKILEILKWTNSKTEMVLSHRTLEPGLHVILCQEFWLVPEPREMPIQTFEMNRTIDKESTFTSWGVPLPSLIHSFKKHVVSQAAKCWVRAKNKMAKVHDLKELGVSSIELVWHPSPGGTFSTHFSYWELSTHAKTAKQRCL